MKDFEARNGNFQTSAVVKNQETKQRVRRIFGDCWQWESNGQCPRGDNCSFRHDMNKRAKPTQPNPSPRSSTRQNERNASRIRSPRGRSPSGRTSRWPCKDSIRCVRFTQAVVRHANIRDQNPSVGMICPGGPYQRNQNAPKFEDLSQEERGWQERWAREAAWRLAKSILKLMEEVKTAFFSPSENWCLPAP